MENKLVIFSASWCRPCQRLKKVLDSIEDQSRIVVYDLDINQEDAISWNVDVVPTILLVNHVSQELRRLLGTQTKEKLLELLNE